MRDVTDRFHVSDIDPNELTQHLMFALHHATYSMANRIDLPNTKAPKVQIHYSHSGEILKIVTVLTDEELRPIVDRIEDVYLGPTRKMVQRFISFVDSPVVGTWECEAFTITAAPPEAPRPQQLLASHPYVLEVPFDATSDDLVNVHRANRLRARYELLLSLFVHGTKVTGNRFNIMWGIYIDRAPQDELKPHLVQEFYNVPGFSSIVDSRTPSTEPFIKLIPDAEYYNRPGRTIDTDFDLPESLAAWINAALHCDDRLNKQLLRAAYWLRHAYEVLSLSQSASLVAAVQAIEVLLPAMKGEACPTCEREISPGPTKKFKEFLQQYAPTGSKEERKARDLLYKQRSQLIHGHELLGTDGDYYFGLTNPAHAFDRQTLDGAMRLARISAINWFIAQTAVTDR